MADKKAFVISDFKDGDFDGSGVEHRFTAGDTVTLPNGVFINYEHAGLVRAPSADDKKSEKPAT